jgi:hypothetical protein
MFWSIWYKIVVAVSLLKRHWKGHYFTKGMGAKLQRKHRPITKLLEMSNLQNYDAQRPIEQIMLQLSLSCRRVEYSLNLPCLDSVRQVFLLLLA